MVRNVTGCPLAGLRRPHELIDASPLAVEIAHKLTANPEFYNLPRKFKISVTGCPLWCSYPEINDVALTAIKREVNGLEEIGYTLRVGGGLSTEPHIAVRIPAFIPQDEGLRRRRGRPAHLPRADRAPREPHPRAHQVPLHAPRLDRRDHARGHREPNLVTNWTPPRSTRTLSPTTFIATTSASPRSVQPGLSAVGASVMGGRLSGDQLCNSPISRRSSATAICAPPSCRTSSSSTCPTHARATWSMRSTHRPAGRGHALLARRHRLHRHRVLQARHRRDQGLLQMADLRDGGPPARLRPADQAARHRLHQLLRPELDRGHRPRRQEDQEGRQDGRRVLLLRRRGRWQVRRHRPPDRLPRRRRRLPRRHRAPAAPYLAARKPGEDLRAYFARTDDESLRAHSPGDVRRARRTRPPRRWRRPPRAGDSGHVPLPHLPQAHRAPCIVIGAGSSPSRRSSPCKPQMPRSPSLRPQQPRASPPWPRPAK